MPIGLGIGLAITRGGTPGFSLTAPVLTLLSAADDNTPLWGFDLISPQADDVIRIEWDDAIPYVAQVSFSDYTITAGDLSGDFEFDFGLPQFANGDWSWRAYHMRGASSSDVSNTVTETLTGFDSTAPTLSSPTDAETGTTTADVGVDTNDATGTLYCVVTTSATPPTAAQVKLGQDDSGVAATFADDQAISSTGTKAFSATGLTAATAYTAHFMHEDVHGNQSTVASADGFTTDSSILDPYSLWNGTSRAGYWWDNSDLTAIWKETVGVANSNVSADGDQVRIVLDKSRMGGLTAAAWLAAQTNLFATPDFASDTNWTKGTGWTIAGGVAVATAAAEGSLLYQNTFTNGAMYYLEFTVSGYSAGGLKVMTNGSVYGTPVTANGTYKVFFKAGATSLGFAAHGTTTLNVDNVRAVRLHDGTANSGVWVGASTDVLYKVSSGKHAVRFPGTDAANSLGTANGGQVLTSGGAVSMFLGIDPLADTQAMLMYESGAIFAGVYQSGSGNAPDAGAGTITYFVDGVEVTSATRDTLNTAIAGARRVVEIRGIDLSTMLNLAPYFYGAAGFGGLAEVYQIIAIPSPTSQERSDITTYIGTKI